METSGRSRPRAQRARRPGVAPRSAPVASLGSTPSGPAAGEPEGLRVAILDSDSGFLVVLAKRLERLGWRHRMVSPKVSAKALDAIEADVLIVDLALLGAQRWKWLSRLCDRRPDPRVIVCTGGSPVAARGRGRRLGADDGRSKPCHPEELIARVEVTTAHRSRPEERAL